MSRLLQVTEPGQRSLAGPPVPPEGLPGRRQQRAARRGAAGAAARARALDRHRRADRLVRRAHRLPRSRPRGDFAGASAQVSGRFPPAVKGVLFRNGPAIHDMGGLRYQHWFDGDGMGVRAEVRGGAGCRPRTCPRTLRPGCRRTRGRTHPTPRCRGRIQLITVCAPQLERNLPYHAAMHKAIATLDFARLTALLD